MTSHHMDRDVLLALAERCEWDLPNFALDCAIASAVGFVGPKVMTPAYTASVDSAVTLVPEGFSWSAGSDTRGDASVDRWGEVSEQGAAKTAALALCAAALRARAGAA